MSDHDGLERVITIGWNQRSRSPGTRTKRSLYQAIVRRIAPFGVQPRDVKIILHEVARDNVGMQGGKAATDVELGYEVEI